MYKIFFFKFVGLKVKNHQNLLSKLSFAVFFFYFYIFVNDCCWLKLFKNSSCRVLAENNLSFFQTAYKIFKKYLVRHIIKYFTASYSYYKPTKSAYIIWFIVFTYTIEFEFPTCRLKVKNLKFKIFFWLHSLKKTRTSCILVYLLLFVRTPPNKQVFKICYIF